RDRVDDVWLTGPLFCEASRQVATGHLPLLDWSTLETFHHNAHFTPVYPLYFFGILDFCSVAKAVQSQDVIRFVHLGILFANALFLGRVVGLRWVGSAFAAVAIATSLNARELATFPTIVAAAAWLPLALAGLLLILEKRAYAWGAAVFVGAVSLLLYAGPGSNMIAGFAFLCLILFCGWAVRTVRATGLQGLVAPLLVLT
ncbi:hypothetical protein, partial [Corallococcus exiguus]|uniref:hypothetical protein n=1 Tax=Corallococcus exiguus TaxID=83462 RepID=UPI001B8AD5FE